VQNFPNEKQIERTWPILLSLRAHRIGVQTNRFACCLRPKSLKIRESRTPWSHTSLHHFWHPSLGELLFRFHPFYLLLLLATIYVVWFYLVALIFILTAFSIVSPWCTATIEDLKRHPSRKYRRYRGDLLMVNGHQKVWCASSSIYARFSGSSSMHIYLPRGMIVIVLRCFRLIWA